VYVKRAIVGFYKDEYGDWVAALACGHRQYVRRNPPWQNRPWVQNKSRRNSRLGMEFNCKKCDTQAASDTNGSSSPRSES
jgi:ribosomal protein L44E